jgi:hypothetical protein
MPGIRSYSEVGDPNGIAAAASTAASWLTLTPMNSFWTAPDVLLNTSIGVTEGAGPPKYPGTGFSLTGAASKSGPPCELILIFHCLKCHGYPFELTKAFARTVDLSKLQSRLSCVKVTSFHQVSG